MGGGAKSAPHNNIDIILIYCSCNNIYSLFLEKNVIFTHKIKEKMKRKELLAKCRYYTGANNCPRKTERENRGYLFWISERMWVLGNGQAPKESLRFLANCGLSDESMQLAHKPAEYLEIPLDLRAYMFENFCRYSDNSPADDAKFFADTVLREYLD